MARKATPGFALLEHCNAEIRRVMGGWAMLPQLLAGYQQPGADKAQMEMQFLRVKSELARALSSLDGRMNRDCRFSTEALNFIGGCTSLEQLFAQSEVAVKKVHNEWHRTFMAMNEQQGEMEELRRRALAHERLRFAGQEVYVPPPFPWLKVLGYGGAAAAVFLLVVGGYVARNFFGIGAPAAGAGMQVDQSLSEEEQLYVMLARMKAAFERKDLDLVMSAFADSFRDVEGRGKTALRALLKTYMSTVGTESVKLDTSAAKVSIAGEEGSISPIKVETPQISIDIVVKGRKIDGVWLITFIDEA